MNRSLALFAIVVTVTGCASSQAVVNTRCSSILRMSGAALSLTSATDAATGAKVDKIMLSQITIDGRPAELAQLLQDKQASGLRISGDTLECTLPCGLSSHQGTYSFQVDAEGYQPATQSVVAKYATSSRGSSAENCAVTLSDGTTVEITLQPR